MELAWMLSASLVAVCAASIPAFHNPLFYFRDDFQIQFMPMFGEIARLIKSGEFPFMTDRVWFGGAILGEYQFGVFNPVSLALYVAIDEINRPHHAATLFVLVHIAILAGGLYRLAREFGADQMASLLAAVVGSTSSWLIYWAAASWIPALVGSTWFPWAVWGLLRVYHDRRWLLPAAFLSYMVLVSGWPYANVALAATLAATLPILFFKDRSISACAFVAAAFGSALLLAAPALFPVLEFLEESNRMHGRLWRPALGDVVFGTGIPLFPTVLQIWTGDYRTVLSPSTYYLSWFVPLVLVNAVARRPHRGSTEQAMLWAASAVLLLLCVAPALWQFKYPFRFLPYLHVALVLLVAVVLTEEVRRPDERGWRFWPTAVALALPFYIAFGNAPEAWALQVFPALAIVVFALVVVRLQRRQHPGWRMVLVATHLLLFFALTAVVPFNQLVPGWSLPSALTETDPQETDKLRTFTLYSPGKAATETFERAEVQPDDYWLSLAPANTALYRRTQTINGYTAFLQRGFQEVFCLKQKGGTCEEGPSRVSAIDPGTKLSYLDLMGVDRVAAERGPYSDMFATHAGTAWTIAGQTELLDIFERTKPQRRVGNIVQWPEAGEIRMLDLRTRSESYDIALDGSGGRIVVARAWYPGITARLNGKEMQVESIAGIVPSVILPAGARGTLTIAYWPAGLTLGIYAAVAGLIILVGFTALQRRLEGQA